MSYTINSTLDYYFKTKKIETTLNYYLEIKI